MLGYHLALMSLYLLYILETDRIDSFKKKRGGGAIVRVGAIADDVLEGENKYFFKDTFFVSLQQQKNPNINYKHQYLKWQ